MIRRAVPTDAACLAELASRTFRETFAADNAHENMSLHLARAYGVVQQGHEIADPGIDTLVVVDGEQLIGFAQLRRGPAPACVVADDPVELWRFYVAREWHGQGIAQHLMQRVEHEAELTQASTLWLGVWERNERAKAFYRKYGFVDVGAHVFMVGNDRQTDRILVRSIGTGASP